MNNSEIKALADNFLNLDDVQSALYNLKVGDRLEEVISIFDQKHLNNNVDESTVNKLVEYLNQEHSDYIFNLGRGFGAPHLYIAWRKLKKRNEKNHESKTMLDLEKELNKVGIHTDILFHTDPDKLLTDDEFEFDLTFYKSIFK